MRTKVSLQSMGALIEGRHDNPFELLGPHEVDHDGRKALAIRAFLPHSKQAWVVDQAHGVSRPMRRIHPAGVYEAICPLPSDNKARYQFRVANERGELTTTHDPYSFDSLWSEYDFYLFGQGKHSRSYDRLGAQPRTIDGIAGTNFSVWAPNARGLSIVGDFNDWEGRRHAMRKHHANGVWELFVPQVGAGQKYKFRVHGQDGQTVDKADPYGFAAELPPYTASVVSDLRDYTWDDSRWMERRRESNPLEQPVSVYELHLGSWLRNHERLHGWLNYRELAHELVEYCQRMGFTHVELMPISEHPYTGSWGYQTVGYYSVTSRYGTPRDFMYFVDHCHQHDIGVIIDWVPAHFPRDAHGLRRFDGTALYEHSDPRQGEHPDWGTLIFNYGRNEVRDFLVANALFWLEKYHIDGLRVDAVASMLYLDYSREEGQWVPNKHGGRENLDAIDLLRDFNERVHAEHPGAMTIAEESTSWGGVSRPTYTGGLGFTLKWNMGWMNDTLGYMRHDSIHRNYHHDELTFSMIYAYSENFVLPLSHDEVVHGKGSLLAQMSGDLWQKFANLRLLYSYMWTHPGKKLLFMGGEFGQWNEWNCDDDLQWDLLDWPMHDGLQRLVSDLNRIYRQEPALHQRDVVEGGFEWIDCHNRENSVLIYLRRAKQTDDFVIVCCNYTPVVHPNYRFGVPVAGAYDEIFNSDSRYYGGSDVGNPAGAVSQPCACHGLDQSISVTLPPLSVMVFKPRAKN